MASRSRELGRHRIRTALQQVEVTWEKPFGDFRRAHTGLSLHFSLVRLGVRVTTQCPGPKVLPFTGALGDMRENPPRVLVALSTGAGRGSSNSRTPGLEQSNAKLGQMSEAQATPPLEVT
ncbi:hypothetical protein FCOIX_8612 [Fusarium coicis]|nr:hypothetical protein FCOIX_8612 [Fusarium coicis]